MEKLFNELIQGLRKFQDESNKNIHLYEEENFIFWKTTNINYHTLLSSLPDGYLLITKNPTSKLLEINELNPNIYSGYISTEDYINKCKRVLSDDCKNLNRLCLCEVMRNSISKYYSKVLDTNIIYDISKFKTLESYDNNSTYNRDFDYLIIEPYLLPIKISYVRNIVSYISFKNYELPLPLVFYVEDDRIPPEATKGKKTIYTILKPNTNSYIKYSIYSIYEYYGILTSLLRKDEIIMNNKVDDNTCNLENRKISINKEPLNNITISEFITNLDCNLNNKEMPNICIACSRYDIYNNSAIYKRYEDNFNVFYDKFSIDKVIRTIPGPFISLFVRWSINLKDQLYPCIPKPTINNIYDGLFIARVGSAKHSLLPKLFKDIEILEKFIEITSLYSESKEYSKVNSMSLHSIESKYSSNENIKLNESEEPTFFLRGESVNYVSSFIKQLLCIWSHSILHGKHKLSEVKQIETEQSNFNSNRKSLLPFSIDRIDMDFTDHLWHYLKRSYCIKDIYDTINLIIEELEESSFSSKITSRLLPFVRDDNETIIGQMSRLAIQISKLQRFDKNENDDKIKVLKSKWKNYKHNWCLNISMIPFIIIQIGIECIINDMKLVIKKADPSIDETQLEWYLDYISTNILNTDSKINNEVAIYEHMNKNITSRIKRLLCTCELASLCLQIKIPWDILHKIMHTSLEYYKYCSEISSPLFALPIYNKNIIKQYISSRSPNDIDISVNDYFNINFQKINPIDIPVIGNHHKEESLQWFNTYPVNLWNVYSEIELASSQNQTSNKILTHYSVQIKQKIM
ncbi:uncharacterized protein CMU_009400 [Cryptosporidium muris RN66]|uniref:Uncharacterized protein n=1 Tax=Cryptosporidium muris (strain RN66) TaxID=441375 RepID=B6AE07_CRYMR|nr:uncharacterized protein CMU_009400 [Cryptosporidium muris RN66]EEA06448.1 hypothetical protein, conserved [Cryptosporidium muris RN66]|eukprot:XP_002140797.1 hypothetical protein [Cryptosporidium muris RN66]